MESSSEILARVEHVFKKKHGMGCLTIFDNRIVWQSNNSDDQNTNISLDDVKAQKISPADKEKVQLQICLRDNSNLTVQFCNPAGLECQLNDRNKVKELLQLLLAKWKQVYSMELEKKQKILHANPGLLKLYENLVTKGIVKPEEFWSTFAADTIKKEKVVKQKLGVSGGFLGDVVRNDGCNEIKFSLSLDIIESIFNTYPTVKKKHDELVPSKMEENDFWSQFFNSQYFQRDRDCASGEKDTFADCIRNDNEDFKNLLEQYETEDPQKCSIGTSSTIFEEIAVDPNESIHQMDRINRTLMSRLNYHSAQIVRCQNSDTPNVSDKTSQKQSFETSSVKVKGSLPASSEMKCSTIDQSEESFSRLILTNHSQNQRFMPDTVAQLDDRQMFKWLKIIKDSSAGLNQLHTHSSFNESAAVNFVLRTFSTDETNERQQFPLTNPIFNKLVAEARDVHFVLTELLRNFWRNFPPLSTEAEQKVGLAIETLEKFEANRLVPTRNEALSSGCQTHFLGLEEMWNMLNTAYAKYKSWKVKKYGNSCV